MSKKSFYDILNKNVSNLDKNWACITSDMLSCCVDIMTYTQRKKAIKKFLDIEQGGIKIYFNYK